MKVLNYDVFLSLKIVFIFGISVNPDEMLHNAAFHQGLHCLPKYLCQQSSTKIVLIATWLHKMLVRIANREGTDLGLHCLPRHFLQGN